MSNQGRDWSFFTSPQFSVIAATVLVLISGAVMYDRLDSKVENLRTETKSDVEKATDKIDGNFDKLDAKFDKIDTKFQQMADKIDDGNRELRSILQTKPAATATATTTPAT